MPDKVLVIDDSAEIHTLVRARLAKEQVVIHCALDAASGLAAAAEICPDLILLDVDMPDRSGFDLCAELKSNPDTMNAPIIFLTGAASTQDKIRGLDLGAADYVTKPFDPAELRARVRASLRTRRLLELLSTTAKIDGLTELWNRAYLDARLNVELASSRRSGRPLSCIMADLDRFKSINDAYGHSFGDDVLRKTAAAFKQNCRAEDIVCRYGGEEFTVLLPDTTIESAAELAERLRMAIEAQQFTHRDATLGITCSFGVAELCGPIPPTIIELADEALYRAKRTGRNRVEVCLKFERCNA